MPPDAQALAPEDFANKIRTKFPGQYDDMPDTVLTNRILAKFPQYRDMVNMDALPQNRIGPQAQAQQDIRNIIPSTLGPNETEQTPERRAARQNMTRNVVAKGASWLPDAGMIAGSVAATPGDVAAPGVANVVGAGLGRAAGTAAQRGLLSMIGQGQGQPAPLSGQNAADLGRSAMQGAAGEMGGQIIGKGVEASIPLVKGAISRMAGVPEAEAEVLAQQQAALRERGIDVRQNRAKFDQAQTDNAAANMQKQGEFQQSQEDALRQRDIVSRQNRAKYEQAQTDLATANAEKQAKYRDDLANAQERIPPGAPGEQETWIDLNKSLQVKPNKIRVKLGAPDLSSVVSMPGRGLAQEGLPARELAAMTPIEQMATIAPKWNAAGQAVDATAAQATAAGKTVNLYKLDESVDALEDPNARQAVQKVINRVGKSLGIRNWGSVTPKQALELRRELWNAGKNGEYVSRAISNELRDAVPELKTIDQHYSDLNGAITTVRDNLKNYYTGKFKLPQMNPDLPEPPTLDKFQHPSYGKLPQVPSEAPAQVPFQHPSYTTPKQVPAPDLKALQDELVKKFVKGKVKQAAPWLITAGSAGLGAYEATKKP